MKNITLTKQEWHDLTIVLNAIINNDSANIEFKDIISAHKAVEEIRTANKEYTEKSEAISKQREELLKVAQAKIDAKREELKKKTSDEKKINAGLAPIVTELQNQLADEIMPQFEELNKTSTDLEIELSDEKYSAVITLFEGFAKDKYNNKDAMVKTYEKLTA